MSRFSMGQLALTVSVALLLAGCEEGSEFKLFQPKDKTAEDSDATSADSSVKLVERDIEVPEVFQITEDGLWDGRPSLGGVWVAYPDVQDPERVIIRNTSNGKFVIGALFRRERENPGPKAQVSSDAAAALGMLAGQPTPLNVTALRREEVPDGRVEETDPVIGAPEEILEGTLDPIKSAAAAIDRAETVIPAAAPVPKPKPAAPAVPATPAKKSSLSKPFVQLGIFSVEDNANATAEAMRKVGVVPTVKKQTSSGKTFWRVLIGPANNSAERDALLKKIKAQGFNDAYFVTN